MSLLSAFSSGSAKRAAGAANDARIAGLRTGEQRATGLMDEGLAAARPQYDKAIGLFDQYTQQGGAATGAYGDAIGLGGADGYERATESFRTGPGYQFAVDQATEAAKRNASSLGMLGSGNTMMAIADRSQGLADQEYQRYLDNLFRASGQGQSAATTQAGLMTGLGDLQYGHNAAKAGLAHGTETGVGQSNAQLFADRNAANQAASANTWNAIMGVGNLAAKFFGAS
ncbi:hypothetical protein W911_14340 [Hyphomicrobium nitrativorans NL23]|uniref:Uncharacterized protein n=1 Tax=Hyphomicrobium nitrativorans NL23 TaxID=1029756 RepID=V5SJS5_9HYPH|nr:hypothetical protein [Hyphomicrobium nitrativorans]AHB50325.1 hypothetical protein W911_14340 [Hyphomicrobium nitrativorans NL23]